VATSMFFDISADLCLVPLQLSIRSNSRYIIGRGCRLRPVQQVDGMVSMIQARPG
jgi:hypothetical protein